MIEHELILLGLLKESPMHGYEIKKKIKEILSLFAGIDLKSIYYPLAVLEKKGLVIKHINKQGRRPQRFIYKLTPKGQERFNQLLAKSFLDFKRPQFSLDLSLYFLNYMHPDIAKRRLRARMQVLERLSRHITQLINSLTRKKDASLARILEHNLQMVQTEYRFITNLTKTV
ncbi:MAG: helix-turn-helix transcriptional regulator [Deltaproteobacteria bacterium]